MNLAELVAGLAELDDDLVIHAAHPFGSDSEAALAAGPGLRSVCTVAEAKQVTAAYANDPVRMRVARFLSFAEDRAWRADAAERARREFSYGGPAGRFVDEIPSGPGRYAYEPFRSLASAELHEALRSGRRVTCTVADRIRFRVLGAPEDGVLEIGEVTPLDQ